MIESGAVEFNKLPDHTMLAQYFHHCQYQVSGRGAFRQFSLQFKPHNLGYQHTDGLTQHGRFSLNTADPPPQNAKSIHHGGMRIGTHDRVGIGLKHTVHLSTEYHASQVLNVNLVNNSCCRWNDAEVTESLLTPSQERIPFAVTTVFELRIEI